MSGHDRFARLDAAYAMGALGPVESHEFEVHLAGCAECRAAVAQARSTLDLLRAVDPPAVVDETPPDTLLPGLLRRASRERTRRRGVLAAVAVAAAACVAGVVIAVWPSGTDQPALPAARDFVPTVRTPVRANAALVSKAWGTQIDVHCSYAIGVDKAYRYKLRVLDTGGGVDDLGGWTVPARGDVSYVSGTSVPVTQIRTVQILRMDGTPVLELTP